MRYGIIVSSSQEAENRIGFLEKEQISYSKKLNKNTFNGCDIIVYNSLNIPEKSDIKKYFLDIVGNVCILDFFDLFPLKIKKYKQLETIKEKLNYMILIIKNNLEKKKVTKYLRKNDQEYKYDKINGLYYCPNFISGIEEYLLLLLLKKSKWTHVEKLKRKVIHYGYEYSYDRSGLKEADPIPVNYYNLLNRVKDIIKLKENPDQLIINHYIPGSGISPHTDHKTQFKDIIICLSLGENTNINFLLGEDKIPIPIQRCSMYIMTGDSRWKYKHGFTLSKKCKKDRVSFTYRFANFEEKSKIKT